VVSRSESYPGTFPVSRCFHGVGIRPVGFGLVWNWEKRESRLGACVFWCFGFRFILVLFSVHCRRFPLFVATPRPAQARSVAQDGVHCTCPHRGLGLGRDIETYINMMRWMYSTKYRINTLHFSSVPYCISRREDGNSPRCGEKCKSHVYKNNNSPKGMRKSSKKQRNPVSFGDSQE